MTRTLHRMMLMFNELDPRDRGHALWLVSPDVYEELTKDYAATMWPSPELVEWGKLPSVETPAKALGVPVWVRPDLKPDTVLLDVETALTRAIERARAQGMAVNVVVPPKFEPVWLPPAPEVTLRALVRKWFRKVTR